MLGAALGKASLGGGLFGSLPAAGPGAEGALRSGVAGCAGDAATGGATCGVAGGSMGPSGVSAAPTKSSSPERPAATKIRLQKPTTRCPLALSAVLSVPSLQKLSNLLLATQPIVDPLIGHIIVRLKV